MLNLPFNIIKEVCDLKRVDPCLISAIISVESNGNTYATRYEPNYKYVLDIEIHANNNNITSTTELIHQKTSWGLMQVMGAVARELGFNKNLSELSDPYKSVKYGVEHLVKFIDKYNTIEDAVSSYNAGAPYRDENGEYKNKKYVDKIMERYDYLRKI